MVKNNMFTELEYLRELEKAVRAKESTLNGFVQEFGEIIEALKPIEKARENDRKEYLTKSKEIKEHLQNWREIDYKEKQFEALAALKKEREALKKRDQYLGKAPMNEDVKDGDPLNIDTVKKMIQEYRKRSF